MKERMRARVRFSGRSLRIVFALALITSACSDADGGKGREDAQSTSTSSTTAAVGAGATRLEEPELSFARATMRLASAVDNELVRTVTAMGGDTDQADLLVVARGETDAAVREWRAVYNDTREEARPLPPDGGELLKSASAVEQRLKSFAVIRESADKRNVDDVVLAHFYLDAGTAVANLLHEIGTRGATDAPGIARTVQAAAAHQAVVHHEHALDALGMLALRSTATPSTSSEPGFVGEVAATARQLARAHATLAIDADADLPLRDALEQTLRADERTPALVDELLGAYGYSELGWTGSIGEPPTVDDWQAAWDERHGSTARSFEEILDHLGDEIVVDAPTDDPVMTVDLDQLWDDIEALHFAVALLSIPDATAPDPNVVDATESLLAIAGELEQSEVREVRDLARDLQNDPLAELDRPCRAGDLGCPLVLGGLLSSARRLDRVVTSYRLRGGEWIDRDAQLGAVAYLASVGDACGDGIALVDQSLARGRPEPGDADQLLLAMERKDSALDAFNETGPPEAKARFRNSTNAGPLDSILDRAQFHLGATLGNRPPDTQEWADECVDYLGQVHRVTQSFPVPYDPPSADDVFVPADS